MSFLGDLIGGIFGNEAADKQADAMVDATNRSNQTIMQMFERSNQLQMPNIRAGWNALSQQGNLLGMPNLVPQDAVQRAIGASGGGNAFWDQYLQANPDIAQWATSSATQPHFTKGAGRAADYNQDGTLTPQEMAQYHAQTYGQRPMATGGTSGGVPGTVNTGGGAMMPGGDGQPMVQAGGNPTDNAYNAFLGSGFNRAMTDFTANDLNQVKGAYGAGGKALSGSAVGAMGDRLARNRYNAFSDYYSALSGISGTGAQLGSQQASQANQVGQNIAGNQQRVGNIRASSYGAQGQNNANMVNSGINAFAQFFGGM